MTTVRFTALGTPKADSPPDANEFFDLMNKVEEFQAAQTTQLSEEQHACLTELATELCTIGNTLQYEDPATSLTARLIEGKAAFDFYHRSIENKS